MWAGRALVLDYLCTTTLLGVASSDHFVHDAAAGTLVACGTWVVVSRVARLSGRQGGEQGPQAGDQDRDAEPERGVLVVGGSARAGDLTEALTRNLGACQQTSFSGSAVRTG